VFTGGGELFPKRKKKKRKGKKKKKKKKKKSLPPRGQARHCRLVLPPGFGKGREGVALEASRILDSLPMNGIGHGPKSVGIRLESLEASGQFLSSKLFHAISYPIAYGMQA